MDCEQIWIWTTASLWIWNGFEIIEKSIYAYMHKISIYPWIYGYIDILWMYGYMDKWIFYEYMDILWIQYLGRLWIWLGYRV